MSMSADPNAKPNPKPYPNVSDSVFEQFKSVSGKLVCISGAGAGIGFAVAEAMAEAGANLALWYNSNKETVEKAKGLEEKYGIKAKAYQVSVTDPEECRKAIYAARDDFGRFDVFIANAGTAFPGGILEQSLEEWKRVVDVNYNAVFYCAKAAGEIFKEQGSGNFIITASMSGLIVNVPTDQGCYNSTKAAVIHLGKSLAREWREFARVNIVSPGYIETALGAAPAVQAEAFRMAVMGRQGHTREIKGIYLYLASDASSYCTGSNFVIDGGYTLP